MFSTLKMRIFLGVYIFIILSVPIGAYLVSQNQDIKSKAAEGTKPITKVIPKTATPSSQEILNASETDLEALSAELDATPAPESELEESPTIATSFGPTLSLSAILEGRPEGSQSTKLFVGIMEGALTSNPKFLLSFSVNLPSNGKYTNLSLAGLSSGSTYTALLKGQAQIATSSSFIMSPTISNLNEGNPLNLLTGDLNEDNIVNTADYSIVQKAFGSTPNSSTWNELADFNKDSIINAFDLGFVIKNYGKSGSSGAWTSPIPVATSSGGLTPQGSPDEGGYWIWVPK